MPALIDQVSTREERRQEQLDDQAEAGRIQDATSMRRKADANIPMQVWGELGHPFWGERYQVVSAPYGKSRTVYNIVDSWGGAHIEMESTRGEARQRAHDLNIDPTANYNGRGWPQVHNRSQPKFPTDPCDCQDKAAPGSPANVCGGVYGTFCGWHGKHDTCPRAVRGIILWSDREETERTRHDLEKRRRELERSMEMLDVQFESLERRETLAKTFAV